MGAKTWKLYADNVEAGIAGIQQRYNLPRLIALYFSSHGIDPDVIGDYLEPKLSQLSDPYRFPGMQEAVKRLWEAIAKHEPILIHGDYDTDGITSSALLAWVLRQNGATVHCFIPHRFDDGYGFTPESLDKALEAHGFCPVLVTVDCGVTSCEAVEAATAKGIDVIVTDHHEAGSELPKALAIINAKVYPELADLQLLSGVGISFKLSHAFVKYGREHNLGAFTTDLNEILDYVALGSVADIVPILGENRVLVKYGLESLQRQVRPGVRALVESSHLKGELSPSDITFRLAPRINAAGRVGDANVALQLLQSEHIVDAYDCAAKLETYNRVRQEKEQEIYQEAHEQIERNLAWQSPYALLVAGRDWHQGVIGIVASRLARDYNRPTIVLTVQGEVAYGSGRSIAQLNLVDVLSRHPDFLERYGGHPMAVGVGLKTASIAPFFEALEAEIRKELSSGDLENLISYDGEGTLDELTPDFFNYMKKLAPFGHCNPKPLYRFNDLHVDFCAPVSGGVHTRGTFSSREGQINFISFNHPQEEFAGKMIDVLATPQINYYMGRENPQLNVIAVKEVF